MNAAWRKVVTWSVDGNTIDICPACEAEMKARQVWPHDSSGREYCQVSYGMHRGECDVHESRTAANIF